MKRSTHSDRTAAWAAKQEKDWYKAKIYNPSHKTKDQETNDSSSIKAVEEVDKGEEENK